MDSALWRAMSRHAPGCTWVMQAWFLVRVAECRQGFPEWCGDFWERPSGGGPPKGPPYERVEAYLGAVPRGSLLMLDLEANEARRLKT